MLTGEPYADFNYITIGAGPAPETQLREFYDVAQARGLPCLVLLTEAEAERLAPTARALGLQAAGRLPVMTYRPALAPPAATHESSIERIANEQRLRASGEVAARASGMPVDVLQRLITMARLGGPGIASDR